MANEKFETSLKEGAHARLAGMAGDWRGTTRTWFEAGKLGNESEIRGSIRVVLGGRFLLHEYECIFQGKPEQGIALYGYHLDESMFEAAWIDDFHTGTAIQFAQSHGHGQGQGQGRGDGFNVHGTYLQAWASRAGAGARKSRSPKKTACSS
jgi:hypothetical protein